MSLTPQRFRAIRDIIRDRMVQSGVDNYSFVDGQLQIGSTRYAVDACGCGEPECDGLRLRRVQQGFQAFQSQVGPSQAEQGFSAGPRTRTA